MDSWVRGLQVVCVEPVLLPRLLVLSLVSRAVAGVGGAIQWNTAGAYRHHFHTWCCNSDYPANLGS